MITPFWFIPNTSHVDLTGEFRWVQNNQEWKPLTFLIGDGLQAELCRQLTLRTDFFLISPRKHEPKFGICFHFKTIFKECIYFHILVKNKEVSEACKQMQQ